MAKKRSDLCPCCEREPCVCKLTEEVRHGGLWCAPHRRWWPHGLLREPEPRKMPETEG